MRGREEERAVDAVGDDVLVEQRALLVAVVGLVERDLLDARGAGRLPQREEAGDDQTDEHGHDEVGEHSGQRGDDQHVASPRVERIRAPRLENRTICTAVATSTPGQRGDRDHADPPGGDEDDDEQAPPRG